jgi:hypothetical protein
MELVVEVYLNNSKIPARTIEPVGKGLLKVFDIITIQKHDLKALDSYLIYFAKRYPTSKPLWISMLHALLEHDFDTMLALVVPIKEIIEHTKNIILNKEGRSHHYFQQPGALEKAEKLFNTELDNLNLFYASINGSVTKFKKFKMRQIQIIYKNKDSILSFYSHLIDDLVPDILKRNEDGSYGYIESINKQNEDNKKDNLVNNEAVALSKQSNFDSNL